MAALRKCFFIVIGIGLVGIELLGKPRQFTAVATVRPTNTLEPIVPTRTPNPTSISSIITTTVRVPSVTATLAATVSRTPERIAATLYQGRARWGIAAAYGPLTRYDIASLRLGWYLNWHTAINPFKRPDLDFAQTVRLKSVTLTPKPDELTKTARANPSALWLISNEPDVKWQDNIDPTTYARLYHDAYQAIKVGDPTAQIAVGGISQPSPLRLRYLEKIIESYRQQFNTDLPFDVWNIHNFILREERDSWGVDIPLGIADDRGILYQVDDSGNLAAFEKQILDFRRWMAEHGYRNYPLIVSEYGIPMPEDYGFPQERLTAFLYDTFDFFLTTRDPLLGYPADDNRLVQRWCWFSLDDVDYSTGRLFDLSTRKMTATGLAWSAKVLSASNAGEK